MTHPGSNPVGSFPAIWLAQPRLDRLRQLTRGTDTHALATGGSGGGVQGGGSTGGSGFGRLAGGGGVTLQKRVSDGFGGLHTGGLGGQGGKRWNHPLLTHVIQRLQL